jgi:hypothetical protein
MKRYAKYGVSFAILLALAVWVGFVITNLKNQKDILCQVVSEKIGCKIDPISDLSIKILPFISIQAKNISVKNAYDKNILVANNINFHLDWLSIFKKKIIVKGIKIEKPKIFINNFSVQKNDFDKKQNDHFNFKLKRINFIEGELILDSQAKNIAKLDGEINFFDKNIVLETKSDSESYKTTTNIKLLKQKNSLYEIDGVINLEDHKSHCGVIKLNGCFDFYNHCFDLSVGSKNISLPKTINLPYKVIDLKKPISCKSRIYLSNDILKINDVMIDHIDFKAKGNAKINLSEEHEKYWLDGSLDFNLGSSNFNSTFGIKNSQINENKQIFEFNIHNNKHLKNVGRWLVKDVETPFFKLPCNILGSINFNRDEISCGGIQINVGGASLDFYFSNIVKNCQIFSEKKNEIPSCKDFGIKISTDLQKILKLFEIKTQKPIKSFLSANFKKQKDTDNYTVKGDFKIEEKKNNLKMLFNLENFYVDMQKSFQDFIKKLYGNLEIDAKNFDLNIEKIAVKNKNLSKSQIKSLLHIKNISGKLGLKDGFITTIPNLYGIVATKSKLNTQGTISLLNGDVDFKGDIKPNKKNLKTIRFIINGNIKSPKLTLPLTKARTRIN